MFNLTPERRLLGLLTGWLLSGVVVALSPSLNLLWWVVGLIVVALLTLDALWVRSLSQLSVKRLAPHNMAVGVATPIELQLQNRHTQTMRCRVHDLYPNEFEAEHALQELELDSNEKAAVDYLLIARQRGDFDFAGTQLFIVSPLGLWLNKRVVENELTIRVLPNFNELKQYDLLATENRLSQLGIKTLHRRGSGTDFMQLREYRAGDSLRQIHWKTSARLNRPISKEYQDDRDQQVIFLLDCSRRMRHSDQDISLLDQTLNTLLLLSYVVVRQGDAVGVMTFGGDTCWFAPRKGEKTVNQLAEYLYNVQPNLFSADYLQTATELLAAQRKRALVIVLTNTRNEDHDDLQQALRLLARHHLVVLADIREAVLDKIKNTDVLSIDDAVTLVSAFDYDAQRNVTHKKLRHSGIHVLDKTAEKLPGSLISQYKALKRSAVF